jgi:hypothetical protein
MKRIFAVLGAVATMTSCIGCDVSTATLNSYPPGVLKTAEDLQYWSTASAPNVYMNSVMPMMLAELMTQMDAGCPIKTTSGAIDTYQGGCTIGDTSWVGTMTVDNSAPDAGTVRFEDFGFQESEDCGGGTVTTKATYKGSFIQSPGSSGDSTFKVDLVMEGEGTDGGSCDLMTASAAWNYEGRMNDDTGVWNGKGRVGNSERGVVSAETANETIDEAVCSDEAASGTTTLTAGSDTAVITYDGASDCQPTSTVTWTLNGVSQGTVAGIPCSAAPAGVQTLALLVAAAALWRSRRSRRP